MQIVRKEGRILPLKHKNRDEQKLVFPRNPFTMYSNLRRGNPIWKGEI